MKVARAGESRVISRRRVIAGGVGGAALTLAAACAAGGQPPGAAEGGARPGTSTQPVRFMWQIRDNPTYRTLAEWGVTEFKKKYPNATIELNADSTGNFEKTVALMVSDTGPDIFHGWGQLLQQYAGKGVMYNHNDLLKGEKDFKTDDFIDYQWKGFGMRSRPPAPDEACYAAAGVGSSAGAGRPRWTAVQASVR